MIARILILAAGLLLAALTALLWKKLPAPWRASLLAGALLVAACQMGVAAAGGSRLMLDTAGHFGAALGMAFQIRDDMLDVLSTAEELGKPIGSDSQENKNTYMVLMGEEGCRQTVQRLTEFAKNVLGEAFEDTAFLCAMADSLADRKN